MGQSVLRQLLPHHWPPHAELAVDWAMNQPALYSMNECIGYFAFNIQCWQKTLAHAEKMFCHNKKPETECYFCPAHTRHEITENIRNRTKEKNKNYYSAGCLI